MADDIDNTYDGLLSHTLRLRDDLSTTDTALAEAIRTLGVHVPVHGSPAL